MYTNLKNHGGDFRDVLDKEFSISQSVVIASGYASLDLIHAFHDNFVNIADSGGQAKLLLGMAFYEGLGQKKLNAVNKLNYSLQGINSSSGVYVTNGRRYHGKIYHFSNKNESKVYVGSSNFSYSGTRGNIECTVPVEVDNQKQQVINFLDELYSPEYSVLIDKAEITVPGKKKTVLKTVENIWNALKRYNPSTIDISNLSKFEFPLSRIVEKEKSNLNTYFGKGRWNRKTGKLLPRPWYEIELIANTDLNSQEFYPKGDFIAYTDDGYIIPMRTQGDYYKNIRSKQSLQIFGIWLKGKLEKSGSLKKYEFVTSDVLEEYGNDKLTFFKIDEGKYYMAF
jgi:hypothetical protein